MRAGLDLELTRAEGIGIMPAKGWVELVAETLAPGRTRERLLGLGIFAGTLITEEIGDAEDEIIVTIARRFAGYTTPTIEGEELRTFTNGAVVALETHRNLKLMSMGL